MHRIRGVLTTSAAPRHGATIARAAAWEHGALACVLVTHAPLAGAWLLGETW